MTGTIGIVTNLRLANLDFFPLLNAPKALRYSHHEDSRLTTRPMGESSSQQDFHIIFDE